MKKIYQHWIKGGMAVCAMLLSSAAWAQASVQMNGTHDFVRNMKSAALKMQQKKMANLPEVMPLRSQAVASSLVRLPQAGMVAKRAARAAGPETVYKTTPGYYHLVPGIVLTEDAAGNPVTETRNGLYGYIDRDLQFINATPAYDSFLWESYDNTYTEDTISIHPFFNNAGYMDMPVLTATLAGVDSVYQMGAYVADGKKSTGMVSLTNMGAVYNVDVDTEPYVAPFYLDANDMWNTMFFGADAEGEPAYIEMFDKPHGGPVLLAGTMFYVFTPSMLRVNTGDFKVTWVAKDPQTNLWEPVKTLTPEIEWVQSNSQMSLYAASAIDDSYTTLVADSFYVMIEGAHHKRWALPVDVHGLTSFDEAEQNGSNPANTAYFAVTTGDERGVAGQYVLQAQTPDGTAVENFLLDASLNVWQIIGTPYILMADDTPSMPLNETGRLEIDVNGGTLDQLLLDWMGTYAMGARLTATVSASTDGDWLTVSNPTVASGANRTDFFSIRLTASPIDFLLEGRRATLTLSDNYGFSRDVIVYQGDRAYADQVSAVEKIDAAGKAGAVCRDGFIHLTYPSGCTSVSLYNVSGVKLGSYELPWGGAHSISAASLPAGVYLLGFEGKQAQTVKIRK